MQRVFWKKINVLAWAIAFCLLLISQYTFAQPNISLATQFISADSARTNSYMDSGGVWNGTAEVTNGPGDTLRLQVTNTAAGDLADPLVDMAFDLSVVIDVAAGFRLSDADGAAPFNFTAATNATGGDANCIAPAGITATQTTIGADVTINLTDIDLPAQANGASACTFTFDLGFTTRTTAPFVAEGFYDFDYDVSYSLTDGGAAQTPVEITQNVEVREGSVAVLKVANGTSAGLGDPVSYTVSLNGSSNGGSFNVQLTDTLNANLTGLTIVPPVAPAPPGGVLAGNQYTFDYLAPGEQFDFTINAAVISDATALVCPPELRNQADVVHRTNTTAASFLADYEFDLENPLLSYTPVDINVDVNSSAVFSIPVQNIGDGVATNVTLAPVGLDAGFVITSAANEDWQWDAGNSRFEYVGTPAAGDEFLTSGQATTIDFTVTVNSCPGPTGGQIEWTPNYQNVCATVLSPPILFSNSSVTNLPDLNVTKTASAAVFNTGETGSYDISFTSTNLTTLPTDGIANNNEVVITDTMPAGIDNISIALIPASTEVEVVGTGVFTGAGLSAPGAIPAGAQIIWRADREDLEPVFPLLTIDYTVVSPGCPITPGNITVTNTADLTYASCGINNSAGAGFLANQSPAGTIGLNFQVNGTDFETGLSDTNGAPNDLNEGDHIEFTMTYEFADPDGAGAGVFAGEWINSTFTVDLGSTVLAQSMTLINNLNTFTAPMTVAVERISDGATIVAEQDMPGVSPGDTGPLNISLDFLSGAGFVNSNSVNDLRLIIRYTATANDTALGAGNSVAFVETTTLDLENGPVDCTGNPASSVFVQGVNVNLGRADVGITATINNGNPMEVCAIVPLDINLDDANTFTRSDNIDIQFDDSDYRFIAPFVVDGDFNGITLNQTGTSPGNLTWTVAPNTVDALDESAPPVAGTELSFNVQLQTVPAGAAPSITVDVNHDSNETSPRIGAAENDEDFTNSDTITPQVLSGDLVVTFLPPELVLVDQLTYDWTAQVLNTGTGTAYGASFTTTLPTEFGAVVTTTPGADCIGADVTPVLSGGGQTLTWTIGDMAPGATCDLQVRGTITQQSCFQPQSTLTNQITAQAEWGCGVPVITDLPANAVSPPLPIDLAPNNLELTHDLNTSFCELCGEGEIHIVINNVGSLEVSNIQVVEDLLATDLTYVNGSSTIRIDGGAPQAIADPIVGVGAGISGGDTLTWNFDNFVALPEFQNNGLSSAFSTLATPNPQRVEIIYRAISPGETFINNVKDVRADATFDLFCSLSSGAGTGALSVSTTDTIPFNQPIPQLEKFGRNVSAGQTAADYGANLGGALTAGDVPGGTGDLVIWRLDISNLGDDELEDLLITDNILAVPGINNFSLEYVCPTDAEAESSLLNGSVQGNCQTTDTATSEIRDVDDPFGNPANDEPTTFFDVPANGNGFIYLAGTIQNNCTNNTNSAVIDWGCEIDAPAGGIDSTTTGVAAGVIDNDTALMSTAVDPAGILVSQTVTGLIDTVVGSNGIVTITVENRSGGTVRDVVIGDTLPTGYVLDTTFNAYTIGATVTPATALVNPAFAVYNGMIDTVTIGGSIAAPTFTFTSVNNAGTIVAQQNVLRHGDVLTLVFRIIRNDVFDTLSDPEVRIENTTAPATDPSYAAAGNNSISVSFDNTCGTGGFAPIVNNLAVTADPEDLDININSADAELFFLLNDPAPNLNLTVELTNNGGHSADNYSAYVIIGSGLNVVTPPPATQCAVIPQASLPTLSLPDVTLLAGPTVYECSVALNGVVSTGNTLTFPFVIGKQGAGADLTFRADVVGRVETSDGTDYLPPDDGAPAPSGRSDTNDYSFDTIRARILGFTFTKNLLACTEASTLDANFQMTIGEDCTYQLEAGWFGFATPGFGNIEIRNTTLLDTIPSGQGYIADAISSAVFSTVGITTQSVNNAPAAPTLYEETNIQWGVPNTTVDGTADGSLIFDLTTRTLNDALNAAGGDNNHNDVKSDIFDISFEVFDTSTATTILNFNQANPASGYPPTTNRQVDMTVVEPDITIVKSICNETVSGGTGPTCASYANTISGDQDDVYSYRLEVTNATGRATAFDINVTDVMAASDQVFIIDPDADGLDNDGVGGADTGGEGTLTNAGSGNGADEISFTLASLAANTTQTYYFRAQLDASVVPGDVLTNSVSADYDTLPGVSGSQTAPGQASGSLAGARTYTSTPVTADLNVTPLIINAGSKRYPRISRRDDPDGAVVGAPVACPAPCTNQDVVIGEEVEVELEFQIPVATLNNFTLIDSLPDGLACIEAQSVVLPAGNFDATAPLTGPGTFAATACDASTVQWDFGNQRLLNGLGDGDGDDTIYTFTATFIARIQNIASNQTGVTLSNGGDNALPNDGPQGPTVVQVSYQNASGVTFTRVLGQADLNIVEPQITVVKNMGALNGAPPPLVTPATAADAADVIWVEVVIDNAAGAAPLHSGLRIYDDLSAVDSLTFNTLQAGSLVDVDLITRGANQPIFTFDSVPGFYPINAGETRRFAFSINVDNAVEPQEVLDNTIQAAWQSLPDNTIALNTTGNIGVDGADDGLRNGRLDFDPVVTAQNDYNDTNTNNTVSVPALQAVKTDISAVGLVNTIGARRQYQVQMTLPEGVTQNLVIQDNLNNGSGNLVIENEVAFPISYSCSGITTINTIAVNCADSASIAAAITTAPTDEAGGIVNWTIGNIVTQTEDDDSVNIINPSITVQYFARVADTVDSIAGNTVQNTASLSFRNGETGGVTTTGGSATPAITILEPDLIVNATGPVTINAGNTGIFNVTVLNPDAASTPASTVTSTAWDATIVARLANAADTVGDAGDMCSTDPLTIAAPVLSVTESGGANRALVLNTDYTQSFNPTTCELSFTLTPDLLAATTNARLDAGDTLNIQFSANVSNIASDSATFTNLFAATEWFSQDTNGTTIPAGTRQYTRTITNGTPGVDDHEDVVQVQAQSAVLQVQKTLISPVGAVNPGDTLTYQLQITNIGAVGTADFQVIDDLGALNTIPYFVPGSLVINTAGIIDINGAPDDSNSNTNGGTNNQGLVDIRNLGIDPAVDPLPAPVTPSAPVVIEYSVTLQDVIPNNTQIRNSATAQGATVDSSTSPVNIVTISSSPDFAITKTVTDITGDPNLTVVGDTIRYTINVENTGNENAINATLQDLVPAHTRYVANSATLNGTVINANDGGISPFEAGLLINSPDTTVSGALTADNITGNNVATITFDVVIDNVVDSTVISNQAILTGTGEAGTVFEPVVSDDPNTPILNDPTQTIINGGVLLDAQKTVTDINGGDVQAADVLRYTITVQNNGTDDATAVTFTDLLPAGTTYVANSAFLNGNNITGATIPFATPFNISSSDLPVPANVAQAIITAGQAATIIFDVTVNGGLVNGTLIRNQGTITSNEQPEENTDFDGNDENGDQPTDIYFGAIQQLSISKEVQILGGGVATANGQLQYIIQIENTSATTAATNVLVTDTIPAGTSLVTNSATINGSTNGVANIAGTITANYSSVYGNLQPGETAIVSFTVQIDNGVSLGDNIDNTATVSWDTGVAPNILSDSANIDIGSAPGTSSINGSVWLDANHDNIQDDNADEPVQSGWLVEALFNGNVIATAISDDNGDYQFNGFTPITNLIPGAGYSVRFSFPGSNVDLGQTASLVGTPAQMQINDLNLQAGRTAIDENLPLDPNGVVYNSITRQPLAGLSLNLLTAGGTPVNNICFTDPDMQGQTTAANGFYAFDLNFGAHPDCTGTQTYTINYSAYPADVFAQISQIIPPETNAVDVVNCPVDAVPGNAANTCDIQVQATAPAFDIPAGAGTTYYLDITLNDGPAEELFANHLPIDPMLNGVLGISKTTSLKNVVRGQLVPYVITLTETLGVTLSGLEIRDNLPPGFKYVAGSATVNGVPQEPVLINRNDPNDRDPNDDRAEAIWENISLPVGGQTVIRLLLVVGSGVSQGEYTNEAQAFVSILDDAASGIGRATVRLIPDPIFDCSDITGKVYDDKNADGYQNQGEAGIAGVRIVSAKGLITTTDKYGRYHITCAAVPNEQRGSNFILKVDERSLPSGYRMTTENPRVIKLTRGKAVKFNFGASIHRVVRLDLNDAAFETGKTELKDYWKPSLNKLYEQLQKGPSVLRLSYLGDIESEKLAVARLNSIRNIIEAKWNDMACCYNLTIETELYWRRGKPVKALKGVAK